MARLVELTLIVADETTGKGTSEPADPIRRLVKLYEINGECIASYDPYTGVVDGGAKLFEIIGAAYTPRILVRE